MRTAWLIGIAIICLALPARAQEGARAGKPEQAGERAGYRGQRAGRTLPMQLLRQLPQQLELSPEQRTQFHELVAELRTKWDLGREDREQMRALARQYREARQAGETEKAKELRRQMHEFGNKREQLIKEFLNEVETILDEQQIEKLNQFRQELERRIAGPEGGLQRLIRRLPEELDFTEEQRARFDDLMAEQREALEQRREQFRELRPLYEKLREARRAGDEARAAELEQELEEKRPPRLDPQNFLDKLEPILTEKQLAKLAELKARYASKRGDPIDVRRILDAAKRLDLNDEQRARLKEIIRETKAVAGQGRLDAETRAELAQSVKSQIVEMLDANQANEFERMLERGPRHGRHGDRKMREGRGKHGEQDQPGRRERHRRVKPPQDDESVEETS
ncbi:MAG: hypothetical protein KAY37_03220 [Phycisphaerae bacterium]|nr:hypothetical protein [Phycisphaerae bacterium]